MSVNTITGRSAFLALLKDEGITHLFGNPGTSELPIMDALTEHPDLNYMMSMQESLVVYMAEGYSRASGKLSACNVHVAPGLGNAMGAIYAAKFANTPISLSFNCFAYILNIAKRSLTLGKLKFTVKSKRLMRAESKSSFLFVAHIVKVLRPAF